jgi:hypothetical protein
MLPVFPNMGAANIIFLSRGGQPENLFKRLRFSRLRWKSKSLWLFYITTIIAFLDIIDRPVF